MSVAGDVHEAGFDKAYEELEEMDPGALETKSSRLFAWFWLRQRDDGETNHAKVGRCSAV